jgi:hypothetical protein
MRRRIFRPIPFELLKVVGLCALVSACIEPSNKANMGEPRRAGGPVVVPNSTANASPTANPNANANTSAVPTAPNNSQQPAAQIPGLPEGAHASGAIFGNALQVLAYKVDPPAPNPGETVKVTVWLRVLNIITDDYMMFVHVDDVDGRPERVNADHFPANHREPMTQWKRGDIIVDQFPFALGGFSESRAAVIWMGFWQADRDERMPITNPSQVKNDGNNRLALAEVPLTH